MTAEHMTTPTPDLTALREHAQDLLRGENISEIEPSDLLALLDRIAELTAQRDGWAGRAAEFATAEATIQRVRELAERFEKVFNYSEFANMIYRTLDGAE